MGRRSAKLPPNAGFGIKNLKKFSGGNYTGPGRGQPPPASSPSTATCRALGRKLPRCWDLGLGNRSPKSKFTTTPPVNSSGNRRSCASSTSVRIRYVISSRSMQPISALFGFGFLLASIQLRFHLDRFAFRFIDDVIYTQVAVSSGRRLKLST